MSRICLGLRFVACAIVFSAVAALAQNRAPVSAGPKSAGAPLPPALLAAKTIFVSNAGADGGLFPHPFSGDPDRGYDKFFADLQGLGQYQIVADPSQADLVLELRLTAPNGPTNPNKQYGAADPLPEFRLVIYDRKSHYVLWALTEPIYVAVLQQTHDRNFDEALANLLADFQGLTRGLATAKP